MADRSILIQGLIELHLKGEGGQQAVASMQKIIDQAKQVEKSTGGVAKQIDQSTSSVGLLDKAFGKLAITVGGLFAASALTNFLRDSYIGFARVERQALVVENQIRSLGNAADADSFRPFIAQLSQTSGILDDELIPAFQKAITIYRDFAASQQALELAARFAAAGIGDVASNVEAFTTFFQSGRAQALKPFISDIKGAADGTISWAEVLPQLKASIESLGEPLNDAQRKLDNLANGMDFISDTTGALTDAFLNLVIKGIRPALIGLSLMAGQTGIAARAALAELDDAIKQGEQKAKDSAVKLDALNKVQSDRQDSRDKARDKEKADKKAEAALKAEEERLEKVKDLNDKSAQDLLRAQVAASVQGSDERFALEIELNERIEAAAIASAQKIGADTTAIAKFFALERLRILNQPATNPEAGTLGPGNAAGREEFERQVEAFREAEEKKTEIAQEQASLRMDIDYAAAIWNIEQEKAKERAAIDSAQTITGVLSSVFAKNKAFSIAMLIVNTALAASEIWAEHGVPWYVKLANTVVLAAMAHKQLQTIKSASIGGGGSVGGSEGGGIASAPTRQAQPPVGSAGVASPSQSTMAAISGNGGFNARGDVVINIGTAFGDQQAMTKLSRQLEKVTRNNQSVLR